MPQREPMPSSPQRPGSRCAIYTRQSRTRPGVASSCEMQYGICADFAAEHGWILTDERFDDPGESSESFDRPALRRLLQRIEQGKIDRVVVYSIDRLTRKLYDFVELLDLLERHDVELGVLTDPHFGESAAHRLTSNVVAAVSEFQLEMTRERMADSRRVLKRKGRRVAGRVPYGYRADGATKQLVIQPDEAAEVRRAFELAAAGKRPQEIANKFNEENIVGTRGRVGTWTARQILKVLSNPTYTGAIHNGAGTLPGRHEPVVTQALFDQVRKSIEARRSRAPGREGPQQRLPLQGKLICGQCGRVMSPSVSGYKVFEYSYYRCRSRAAGRPPCNGMGISAYEIEQLVCMILSSEDMQLAEFSTAWCALDSWQQRKALANVVKVVHVDPNGGTISVTLADDALEQLRRT